MTDYRVTRLDRAQAKVEEARADLAAALAERKEAAIDLRYTPPVWSTYAIAKHLGIANNAARGMLGL